MNARANPTFFFQTHIILIFNSGKKFARNHLDASWNIFFYFSMFGDSQSINIYCYSDWSILRVILQHKNSDTAAWISVNGWKYCDFDDFLNPSQLINVLKKINILIILKMNKKFNLVYIQYIKHQTWFRCIFVFLLLYLFIVKYAFAQLSIFTITCHICNVFNVLQST